MQPLQHEYEGFLHKKGQKRRNWKKRWFCLQNGTMLYYANEKKKQLKGEINIDGNTLVDKAPNKPFCFYVENAAKRVLLCAKDEHDQQAWIEAIRMSIQCIR